MPNKAAGAVCAAQRLTRWLHAKQGTVIMNVKRVEFAGLSLRLPEGWFDVTDDLEKGSPFTLGKDDNALGALQFSVGLYISGKLANIDMDGLSSLFHDFIASQNLGTVKNVEQYHDGILSISGEFVNPEEFIRLWFVTDKINVAMITYVSTLVNDPSLPNEVAEADQIVKSISF